jgi:predicted RNase H-like nuclease
VRVLGIDAWREGWVAVVLDEDGFVDALSAVALAPLVEMDAEAAVVGVDVPIGLPHAGERRADLEARHRVSPRGSSVFPTAPRPVLEAASHAEATRLARALTGRGISQQTFALRLRILEAEAVAASDPRVREVHPEVSFRALAGRPLAGRKKTWNGQADRVSVLAAAGIRLPPRLPAGERVPPDDLLDAAAVAWSARRIARGEHATLPADPAPDEPRIWY